MSAGATSEEFDVVVVGGGPAGATAATDLAIAGLSVMLLDKAGRIKPCGGAVPPRLIEEFSIATELLVAKIDSARIVAPSARSVDMVIEGGYVGMVDREQFDEWLRLRAERHGARLVRGEFERFDRDYDGRALLRYRLKGENGATTRAVARARAVIGADGARSQVAAQCIPGARRGRFVAAYHEIVRAPLQQLPAEARRCEVHYRGCLSPDFYGWVFPHGGTLSIGVGSAQSGFSLRQAVQALRRSVGLESVETVRREGAPIPLRALPLWDNRRDVILAGDAAGVVAPASGEGIYYAMVCGRMAAEGVRDFLESGESRRLALARKRFMKAHGRVFWILGLMQHFWYRNDQRRERFVSMCRDPDVQRLTWQAYLHKRLVRRSPRAHIRIFFKDLAHLLHLVRA